MSAVRRLVLPVVVLVVGLPAGIGAVMTMGHRTTARDSAFAPTSQGRGPARARHAQPRWEPVSTFTGSGPADTSFSIAAGAAQWRARWSCDAGRLRMTASSAGAPGELLADSACPRVGTRSRSGGGRHALRVSASGPWRVVVEQQVDTALEEPPLAGMARAAPLARGRLRSIQRHAEGTVSLYRLASGRLALRFTRFYTTASPGLVVWLSGARAPGSTLDARESPHVSAGRLRATLGSYNQMLPRGLVADEIHSVVIWCPTVLIAFGAASLTAPAT